jgi:hypothetical protein
MATVWVRIEERVCAKYGKTVERAFHQAVYGELGGYRRMNIGHPTLKRCDLYLMY